MMMIMTMCMMMIVLLVWHKQDSAKCPSTVWQEHFLVDIVLVSNVGSLLKLSACRYNLLLFSVQDKQIPAGFIQLVLNTMLDKLRHPHTLAR